MASSRYWAVIRDADIIGHGLTPDQALANARANRYSLSVPDDGEPLPCTTQLQLYLKWIPDALIPAVDARAGLACMATCREAPLEKMAYDAENHYASGGKPSMFSRVFSPGFPIDRVEAPCIGRESPGRSSAL